MPNIIEPKKIKRIVHRFDTTENWRKSNVKLLPGELAFDEHGNFKVGVAGENSTWNSLKFAGKSQFVTGTTSERPTVSNSNSMYAPGDMFKDTEKNKWYFLTGFDAYGEYVWEELTFGHQEELPDNIIEDIENIEKDLASKVDKTQLDETISIIDSELNSKASKEDVRELNDALSTKVGVEELKDYVTKEEIEASNLDTAIAITELKEELTQSITNVENVVSNIETTTLQILEQLDSKVDRTEITNITNAITQKVDTDYLFDDNGVIKSSLLPGFVDDIVEGILTNDGSFLPLKSNAEINVAGKLYVDVNTKKTYRWSGSSYVLISESLALGVVDGTAYEGSAGKALEDRIKALEDRNPTGGDTPSSSEVEELRNSLENLEELVNKNHSEVESDIKVLEVEVNALDKKVDALSSNVSKLESDVTLQSQRLNSIETFKDDVIEDIVTLKLSNEAQVNRLSAIESKVVEQIESISTLEGKVEIQTVNLTNLQTKVDKLTSIETPDGEMTLGVMAFKDNVTNEDIINVSISKVDFDEEIEFLCGDSTD
jgi:CII-binding regulator of phage lambda lysogenization HflD